MNYTFLKTYIIYAFILLLVSKNLYCQNPPDLSKKLTPETYRQWDKYIRDNAPSNDALKVVNHIANQHYLSGRAMVSAYVYELYFQYFPDMQDRFRQIMNTRYQIGLTQAVDPTNKAIYLQFISSNAPNDAAYAAMERVIEPYIDKKEYDSAVAYYNGFKQYFPNKTKKIDEIINLLKAPEENIVIKNIGMNINTRGSEWDPNPTPDGRFLFFSADHRRGGMGMTDIWFSKKKDGEWLPAENLGMGINDANRETIDNVSADGTKLLLSGNFPSTFGEFDIYIANKDSLGWRSLDHLPMPINSAYVDESANLTADGKALLFTSDRPGAIGGFKRYGTYENGSQNGNMDIYVSLRTNDGWSEPINLGPDINTEKAERSAFLHPDGRTLYFSSEGHPSLGRMDIFKSTRLSDTSWTQWSKPINLGKKINTAQDDWGYKVGVSGTTAYFARNNSPGGFGGWDIYTARVPSSARPDKVATVTGTVKDENGKAIAATIIWEDLATGKEIGKLKSDPTDGNYFIALPLGKNYGYFAENKDYYPASNNLDLRDVEEEKKIKEDIILTSIGDMMAGSKSVEINNIFFDFDKSELREESFPELKRLAKFLKRYDDLSIQILGHTDDMGSEEYNVNLSESRAKAVKEYLIEQGINSDRLQIIGLGATQPLLPNTNEENKAKNRRVEIRALN